MTKIILRFILITVGIALFSMCVPPSDEPDAAALAEERRLDSLRQIRCPRLLSSAAEYYKNRDWASTTRIYNEIVELGCDRGEEEEVYLYYAIAYEALGKYDSSEYVLLKGLQKLPDNLALRKRLAYAYKKQGKVEYEMIEYEKIIDLDSTDTVTMSELAGLYEKQGDFRSQISVLRKLLVIDPGNENAQSEIALAMENAGEDPLDFKIQRVKDYPDNISYKINLARLLLDNGRADEAIDNINDGIRLESDSKPLYRLLGEAYFDANDLPKSSDAYEKLFTLDPRDAQLSIKISEVNVLEMNYMKAIRWANKAISIDQNNGNAHGQKGNVYYKAFSNCRTSSITNDDRIVASLALLHFGKADELGSRKFNGNKRWLEENGKDVLFRKQEWFMLTPEQQNKGFVMPGSECYNWIEEKLMKDRSW